MYATFVNAFLSLMILSAQGNTQFIIAADTMMLTCNDPSLDLSIPTVNVKYKYSRINYIFSTWYNIRGRVVRVAYLQSLQFSQV